MPAKIKQTDFVKLCKEIHKDKYDYSKTIYTNANSKIIVTCKEHGDFFQIANDHKRGRGCYHCGINKISQLKTYSLEQFINRVNIVHNFKYDYSLTNYTSYKDKIIVICKKHGEFKQFAYNHLLGNSCRKCSIEKQKTSIINNGNVQTAAWRNSVWKEKGDSSKNFESFKVYIIKCWNDKEEFYKIGKTFRKIEDRFYKFKYNWTIIKSFVGDAYEMSSKETELKRLNKTYKYMPEIKFGGNYECFLKIENYD